MPRSISSPARAGTVRRARRPAAPELLRPGAVEDGVASFLERLSPLGPVRARRMFGGVGVYRGDAMFAIGWQGRWFFKTDERSRERYRARGAEPFRPSARQTLASFHEVPREVLDDEGELVRWARDAVSAAADGLLRESSGVGECPPEVVLGRFEPAVRACAERARALVKEVAPDAEEAGRPGWNLIGYRARLYFCFIAPGADHVRLGFERGVDLPDPDGLLEGTGTQVRWVRLPLRGRWPARASLRALIDGAARAAREKRRAPRAPGAGTGHVNLR